MKKLKIRKKEGDKEKRNVWKREEEKNFKEVREMKNKNIVFFFFYKIPEKYRMHTTFKIP